MNSSRRSFLQLAGLVMASSAVPALAKAANRPPKFNGPYQASAKAWPVLQGPTDANSTSLIVMHYQEAPFEPRIYGPQREVIPFAFVDRWSLPGSSFVSSELFVSGLLPGLEYELELVDGAGTVFDRRTFRALDLERPGCRFAVVSCMNDGSLMGGKVKTMWESLQREECDFIVFLGDTCYSDVGNDKKDEAGYARRYSETRQRLSWFRMPKLTPVFATWDDHDFGLNNADRSFPRADFNRQLFRKFWGSIQSPVWRKAHGVGSVFEGFGQRFFFMDDRSFRDAPGVTGGRHWGQEQLDWLIAELEKSDKPAWLMNGSQYFGAYLKKESYEAIHPADFSHLLDRLSRVRAPVAFVSGDVHFSEIMAIEERALGYPTYEFTSSSVHSFTFPYHNIRAKNPRRIETEWQHNYLVFDSSSNGGWNIGVRCMTEGNAVSFSRNLSISRG